MHKFRYMKYKTLVKNLTRRKNVKLISFSSELCNIIYHFKTINEFLDYLNKIQFLSLNCKYRTKYNRKSQILIIRYI